MDSAWYLLLHILLAFRSKSHVDAPNRRRVNYILHPSFKGGWESEFSDFCFGEISTDKNISQTIQNCPGCLEKIIVKDSIGQKSQDAIYIHFSVLINLSKIVQY